MVLKSLVLITLSIAHSCTDASIYPPYEDPDSLVRIPLIPHHVQKERIRRRRRLAAEAEENDETSSSSSSVALHHNRSQRVGALYQGYGTHYVDLWCGTPPQRQTLIVDTGSSITAFPCAGCKKCGASEYHIDGLFEQESSSSFHSLECGECVRGHCKLPTGRNYCEMSMSYQEGSRWRAFEAIDQCYVGGPHGQPLPNITEGAEEEETDSDEEDGLDPLHANSLSFDLAFGCQTLLTGLFRTQLADGIMGMDEDKHSFWQQLYAAKKTETGTFALCFGRSPTADRAGSEAGALTLGGFDTRLHKTTLVYTQQEEQHGFYGVHIRKIYMKKTVEGNTKDVDVQTINIEERTLNMGKTIVDSGTTDTYLISQLRAPFNVAWKEFTGQEYKQKPIKLSSASELSKYPTIMIQLRGQESLNKKVAGGGPPHTVTGLAGTLDPEYPYDVIISVPPENYIEYDQDTNRYVPRIYLTEARENVLGANVMMGHDVVFDSINKTVGFAESDCTYTKLLLDNGYDNYDVKSTVSSGLYASPLSKNGKDTTDPYDMDGFQLPTFMGNDDGDGFCSSFACRGVFFSTIWVALVVGFYQRQNMGIDRDHLSETDLHPMNIVDDIDHNEGDPSTRSNTHRGFMT